MSDDGDDGSTYGNTHRAFLQALLTRQTITFEEAKPLISAIRTATTPERPHLPEDVTQEEFEDYLQRVNDALNPFDFEIRSSYHQVTHERIHALVNTTSDALTQMATIHSPDEIAFVKRVLDAMFDTYNTPRQEIMAIQTYQARKLAKAPGDVDRRDSGQNGNTQTQSRNASLTQSQVESLLECLEQEGWFERTEIQSRSERVTVWYTLTQRALMELQQWLVDAYNEEPEEGEEEEPHQKIKFCKACAGIVTVGQRCPNMSCNVRLHDNCVGKMFRAQRDSETCPTCKTEWHDAPPVGIEAAKEQPRGGAGRRATNGTASGGRRSSAAHASTRHDEDEEDDMEVDDELP
ncbi:putative non-structural maintenance of chromosomes element 1, Zinc finger, RING/FYVE/PHD-type [Septoria linicola]|nr:putative non-structural maintenance of chromosomes element 1, Zinc finger, RING/FYVE/PHD-type [Septoria linicola]